VSFPQATAGLQAFSAVGYPNRLGLRIRLPAPSLAAEPGAITGARNDLALASTLAFRALFDAFFLIAGRLVGDDYVKGHREPQEVTEFIAKFQRLRDWIDDDPTDLETLAMNDAGLRRLCFDLNMEASSIFSWEKRHPSLFAAPVVPKFIELWRDYGTRYRAPVAGVFLAELGMDLSDSSRSDGDDFLWEVADERGKEQAEAIFRVIDFAKERIFSELNDFPEDFRETIEEGASAWERLIEELDLDVHGIVRRRELTPFVNIPRHVADRHGFEEHLSLFTLLQQAHDAFIFGAPLAAIALMRSILETTLKLHYVTLGSDLEQKIDNCRNLPRSVSTDKLHRIRRLANDILHFNRKQFSKAEEWEIASLLITLRDLVELVPQTRRR
jgi:hypothetical protein